MQDEQTSDRTPVRIRSAELITLRSTSDGREYAVRVASPLPASTDRCAVVYLHADVDGGLFALATPLLRMLRLESAMPPLWVVSVSPVMPAAERMASLRDFDVPRQLDRGRALLRGFLQDVLPAVEQRYAIDPTRRVLFGHSFSGLQVMLALSEGTHDFCGYVASSPALWRLGDQLPALEARMAARAPSPAGTLFLSAGELEQPARVHGERAYERGALFQNLDRLHWLSRTIQQRAYPGLTLHTRIFPGETHMTALPMAVVHGVGTILGQTLEQSASLWPPVPEDVLGLLERARIPGA